MIISASRRTDIPAFYAEWFMNRIRAGFCTVPNQFNLRQVAHVSLKPEEVEVIVFWTRNPAPLISHLDRLDQAGMRYYFHYTLLNNPKELDVKGPALPAALRTFRRLAERIGPNKVIWRYDPIIFTNRMGPAFHEDTFGQIAAQLRGHTRRVVISLADEYAKTHKRLAALENQGIHLEFYKDNPNEEFDHLMEFMVETASENEMEIVSCAEALGLNRYGIRPGKCVDNDYIQKVFGLNISPSKDPGQRAACGCVVSKDIGMYDSCLFECAYCYATSSFERARTNFGQHDPRSPSMIGHYEATLPAAKQNGGPIE